MRKIKTIVDRNIEYWGKDSKQVKVYNILTWSIWNEHKHLSKQTQCKLSEGGRLIELWERDHIKTKTILYSSKTHKKIFEETLIGKSRFLKIFAEKSGNIVEELVHLDNEGQYYETTLAQYFYKDSKLIKKAVFLSEKYYHRNGHHYDNEEDRYRRRYTEHDASDKEVFVKWIAYESSWTTYAEEDLSTGVKKEYDNDILKGIKTTSLVKNKKGENVKKERVKDLREEGFSHYTKHHGHTFLCPAYKKQTVTN